MEQPTGLLAFWADIDEDYVEEFRRWHNCEHVAERLAVPGFRAGRRYRGIGAAPMFFMAYETDEPAVLKSEAYLHALNNPTPWTRRSLTHFRNPVRTIYRLIASAGALAPIDAPYLLTTRFDIDDGNGSAPARYRDEGLSRMCALPGVYRARLYEADESISGIVTSERRLYGGGPGRQRFCELVELAAPDAPDETVRPERDREPRTNVAAERFWLDFALDAPTRL